MEDFKIQNKKNTILLENGIFYKIINFWAIYNINFCMRGSWIFTFYSIIHFWYVIIFYYSTRKVKNSARWLMERRLLHTEEYNFRFFRMESTIILLLYQHIFMKIKTLLSKTSLNSFVTSATFNKILLYVCVLRFL